LLSHNGIAIIGVAQGTIVEAHGGRSRRERIPEAERCSASRYPP